jgi:hypothetical protein
MERMMCPTRHLLAIALGFFTTAAAAADFYVSPTGSDTGSGTSQQPFATLQRARDAVRQLKQGGVLQEPVTVWLQGGMYCLQEPIVFTPADAGTANATITYASLPGQRAVLSGGRRLEGDWSPVPDKPYWQLQVPQTRNGHWTFASLVVNGQSRTRARYPNWGQKVLRAEGPEPGGDPRQALQYQVGDVDPTWSHPTDIDVVLLQSWTPTIHRIREIVPERRALRFFSAHSRNVDFWERRFRYYLSNVFEALDEPGEWYLNRHTGTLYYYPLPGEDLAAAEVIAPLIKSRMITFAGDPAAGQFVEHLHFRDLDLRHVDGDMDRYDGVYRQGHMYLDSAVSARGLRHASFERCELAQLGEYAMELADGCRDVAVRQCHFWDLGAGGLQLGVTDLATLQAGLEDGASGAGEIAVQDLVIDNNCIHRLGTIWHGCYGIVNRFASRTRITHNEIYDTHWDAIGLDARWNWNGEKYSHGNVVAYNHLHHLGLRYHTDAAGVYQFGPLDTHIHHNLIHDTFAYPYICGFAGIYLDQQSRGALVQNNLVYNVEWFAYFQHKGTDNIFRNNIGAFARNGLIGRGSLNEAWRANYMEAVRNIYIARDGVAISQGWEPGDKPPVVAHNVYHTLAADPPLTFAGKTFDQWQAEGQDNGSIIGDPGCRAPEQFDFRLEPDAPACQAVGFVPFDQQIQTAGLYGDEAWRNVARAYPPRTPSEVWTDEDFSRWNAFDLDLNLLQDGDAPGVFAIAGGEQGAAFAVTSQVPGTRGPKCLKCTDRKGLTKPFYPYLRLTPRSLKRGQITLTFAVRQPQQSPARVQIELRGRGQTQEPGPSLAIARDGTVHANGQHVCTLEPDSWTRFELRFALGEQSTGDYQLEIRSGSERTEHRLPFGKPTFDEITWLGITLPDDADGTVYLDDLALQIAD